MHSKELIAGIVTVVLAFPFAAFAHDGVVHTEAEIKAEVSTLMQQIQALQTQLKALLESSSVNIKARVEDKKIPPGQIGKAICIELKRDLRVGAQGEDVRKLQEMLAADPDAGFRAKATGFFG